MKEGGYQGGPHIYSEREYQSTFTQGVRVKCLKKKRENRRVRAKEMLEKYEKNLLEKVMEMEYQDISDLMDNRPLE